MKGGSKVFRSGTALTGVLILVAAMATPSGAQAQDEPAVPDWAAQHGGWMTWGDVEGGYRAYIKQPPMNGGTWWRTPTNPNGDLSVHESRAKFEEYGRFPKGFFLETLRYGAQTVDGMYSFELRARDIANNNQSYVFDWSKAGELYGTYSWDQIPHLYSTSAQNIWNGVGTNALTTAVSFPVVPPANGAATVANHVAFDAALNGKFNTISIGIQRDKLATSQRWTPNQNWDFRADYSHEHRYGTQLAGVLTGNNAGANVNLMQVPRPVEDVTQDARLAGEYIGSTGWGGKFNLRTSAGMSTFRNGFDSYTVQNPFYMGAVSSLNPQFIGVSLAPDNNAANVGATAGVDLPFKSRYMGTLNYTMMRQNDPFPVYGTTGTPLTSNPGINLAATVLPALSANAQVDTLLFNNVVNTQVTDDLKATLKYRYYNNNNTTPELMWQPYVIEDWSATGLPTGPARRNLAYSYTKQNASEDVTWRATKQLTVGVSGGWEQWDRNTNQMRRSVDVTNEYFGKVFMDAKIGDNIGRLRASYEASQRMMATPYDYVSTLRYTYYTGTTGPTANNLMMRQFDLNDRNRNKASASVEINVGPSVTVTPTAGMRFDSYKIDQALFQSGLKKDNNWNAGVEIAYAFQPGTNVMFAYVYEDYDRYMVGTSQNTALLAGVPGVFPPLANFNYWAGGMVEKVHTFIVSSNIEVIPNTLDLKLNYVYALANENWTNNALPGSVGTADCAGNAAVRCQVFPTVKTAFQRFDATAKYRIDTSLLSQLGFTGESFLNVRYVWERNSVANWQNDWTTPYMYLIDSATLRNVQMAAVNPNYNAQMIMTSLQFKW
ncbi:MAG: MtrB/PioB family decaheme-associated outer membrane protein [Bradyrhizobium sp.]|uniref:MtrB/PioB family decaheme-associated outer membrane protein n=1 Tax=Bradyrhizobium sp. TaxID=376 RepID=UPI0025BE2DA2|nr:MtrB/PioB family decaheme-associated outer membrane protein [Bradyrhizobium sp.]MBI5260885.1 MtrB/PioB family decaheme-associated outer membrane protein [Bradyrhizobium sp.]